jgi:Transposase IS4
MFRCKSAITVCSRMETDIFLSCQCVRHLFLVVSAPPSTSLTEKFQKFKNNNNKCNAMMNVCACLQLNCNSLASMHEAHLLHLCGWFTKRSCLVHWTPPPARRSREPGAALHIAKHTSLFVMARQPRNICVGWQVEKKAGALKGVVIEAVGKGKWKVRLDDGTVEVLNSRKLKKIKFLGESDGNDDYDYAWDDNVDDLEDYELELAGAGPTTGVEDGGDSGTAEDNVETSDDEFDEFVIGEEDVLDDTVPNVDREAPPTEDKYARKLRETLEKKAQLINEGYTIPVYVRKTRQTYEWRVTEDIAVPTTELEEYTQVGIRGFDFANLSDTPCSDMVMHLWPGNWRKQLRRLSVAIAVWNEKPENRKNKIKELTEMGFWVFISALLTPTVTGRTGKQVFAKPVFPTVVDFNLQQYSAHLSFHQFNLIRGSGIFMEAFKDASIPVYDKWHPVRGLINAFNANRSETIAASVHKVMDESMSAFKPRTTKMGNLPHLSFIQRKPEPLGSEFKVTGDSKRKMGTGCMIHLELQEGKEAMRGKEHVSSLGGTAACTLRMAEQTEHNGQNERPNAHHATPGGLWKGDSWFGSVKAAEAMAKHGKGLVAQIKTNHAGSPKKELEALMKDWAAGVGLTLQCRTPNNVNLVIVAWTYTTKTILVFVATEDAGSTSPGGKAYEHRYNDEHGNVVSRFIERPEIIAHYYEDANAIDVHNQVRQSIIGLERNWVTQDGFFRIFTTVLGMVLTDAWMGLSKCVDKRSPYSSITAREFTGCVLKELLTIRKDLSTSERPALLLERLNDNNPPVDSISLTDSSSSPAASSISNQSSSAFLSTESSLFPVPMGAPIIPENYRDLHRLGKTEKKQGWQVCSR